MLKFLSTLATSNEKKILLMVIDGLGGIPFERNGKTELEAANTPNFDRIASLSACGLMHPVYPGVTPGSGPGHLGLFGYEPTEYQIGRGALGCAGIGLHQDPEDLAIRVNFATIDENGIITDRRAGRIPTEETAKRCEILNKNIKVEGYQVIFKPEKDYRAVLLIKGPSLSEKVKETDPQKTGESPIAPEPLEEEASKTSEVLKSIIDQAKSLLKDMAPANMILLRGYAKLPDIPKLPDLFGIKCGAIATYPMYKGLARLVGMEILPTGSEIEEEVETLKKYWNEYDFFFFHIKPTDSAGEDGNFEKKVKLIEKVDSIIPTIEQLKPDVFAITADHSTPAKLRSHSWHPVPVMIYTENIIPDDVKRFSEREFGTKGILGSNMRSKELLPMLLAAAGKLKKFGA